MARKTIIEELQYFRKELDADTPITKMIFFGSRAWGKPRPNSDIDLIIVSTVFRKKRWINRGMNLYDHWNLDYPVDFLCYTPEEFRKLKNRKSTLVNLAVEKGIEISAA